MAPRTKAGTAVAERPEATLPALYTPPAVDIGAEDVALPKLYIGQHMSQACQEGLVKPGAIFSALGKDDPDPNVLWEQGGKTGVLVHVLGLRKGKSLSTEGELETWDFHDPDAPAEAWTTYGYTVALPEVDEEIPHKWLLTRTGTPTAKQINLILKKNEDRGPAWGTAFRLTAAPRKNQKGAFFVARISQVEDVAKNVAVAENLARMISSSGPQEATPASAARGDEPAI